MNDTYPIDRATDDGLEYEFTSVGEHPDKTPRLLPKRVNYVPIEDEPNGFNLALLDVDPNDPNEVTDDLTLTNGDRDKILDTTFSTLFAFFRKYPYSYVTVIGSERPEEPEPEPGKRKKNRDPNIRIRWYQKKIFRNFETLKTDFVIQALITDKKTSESNWVRMDSTNTNDLKVECEAFVFERIQ